MHLRVNAFILHVSGNAAFVRHRHLCMLIRRINCTSRLPFQVQPWLVGAAERHPSPPPHAPGSPWFQPLEDLELFFTLHL